MAEREGQQVGSGMGGHMDLLKINTSVIALSAMIGLIGEKGWVEGV